MGFSARVWQRDFAAAVAPAGLSLRVAKVAWAAPGGPESAEIEVTGIGVAVARVAGWLRCPVVLYDGAGEAVWWGYVDSVTLPARPGLWADVGLGLAGLANRVAVRYERPARGAARVADTDWAEDGGSVGEYGRKAELVALGAVIDEPGAELARDAVLAARRYPQPALDLAAPAVSAPAVLKCRGWWATLEWEYYASAVGLEVSAGSGARDELLGYGFEGYLAFLKAGNVVDDVAGRLGALVPGERIRLSGTYRQDGAYTVAQGANRVGWTYTAPTIDFAPHPSEGGVWIVRDAEHGFSLMGVRDHFHVTGSTSNNLYLRSEGTGSDSGFVRVWQRLTTEAAGDTVTVQRGHHIRTVEAIAYDDMPEETAGLTLLGPQRWAQGVRLAAGVADWACGQVAVQVARVGLPAGGLKVGFWNDAGGAPGSTCLGSAVVPAASVPVAVNWVEVTLSAAVTLSAGSTVWLVVEPATGAHAPDAYYLVRVEQTVAYSRGELRQWDGVAWAARTPDASLAFRAWGDVETTTQLATMLAAGQFVTGVDREVVSGVYTCPQRDGARKLLAEVTELLEDGDAAGGNLQAEVGCDRRVRIFAEPAQTEPYFLAGDGTVYGPNGERIRKDAAVYGQWLRVGGVDQVGDGGWIGAASPVFIERCQIDGRTLQRELTARKRVGAGVDVSALRPYVIGWLA